MLALSHSVTGGLTDYNLCKAVFNLEFGNYQPSRKRFSERRPFRLICPNLSYIKLLKVKG